MGPLGEGATAAGLAAGEGEPLALTGDATADGDSATAVVVGGVLVVGFAADGVGPLG
jgi:hypothetical protein